MTIADQKTPGRPIEIEFEASTGLPTANQELLLIGRAASGATGVNTVITISNVGDPVAGQAEAETKFGVGSELAKMVVAAINSNLAAGRSNSPSIKCVPMLSTAVDFGTNDAALTAAINTKAEFIVSPFDGTDTTLVNKLKNHCATVSGAQRVENNQFGSIGVAANFNVADPANLNAPDSQYLSLVYMRDSAPAITLGELAAAYAAALAGNAVPFNPVNNFVLGEIAAPVTATDNLSIGAGLESETVLGKGWTPLKVKPNGEVAIVRSITTRITTNGVTAVQSYYDVQDFQVLYYWRKTLWTRFNQTDLTNTKRSVKTARTIKGEALRLAKIFEDNAMFQSVSQLATQFTVTSSLTDRNRFDVVTPVNVIPGLHVIATTIKASTQFDTISV